MKMPKEYAAESSQVPLPAQRKARGVLQQQVDDSPRQQAQQSQIAQLQADAPAGNQTGMPDQLKQGIESLSGVDMSDVQVHRNSDKPAQLNALAYAQGNDIHLGPGQEQHLPHEAWHVVQQRQGRVKPTMQMKEGVPVNDDAGLEREADVMGGRATAYTAQRSAISSTAKGVSLGRPVVQGYFLFNGSETRVTTVPKLFRIEGNLEINNMLARWAEEDKPHPFKDWDGAIDAASEILNVGRQGHSFVDDPVDFDPVDFSALALDEEQDDVVEEGSSLSSSEDDEPEEAVLSDFGLDGLHLYRAEDFKDDQVISKDSIMLYGFFSTSEAYARQYYKEKIGSNAGKKGAYKSMIKITLNKPIGNILLELMDSKDAFNQNSGNVGKSLVEARGGKKAEQKKVEDKRKKDGYLKKDGSVDKTKYQLALRAERNNTPNAVMVKQEPLGNEAVANIEVTSRLRTVVKGGEGVLVEHPLDKYVVSIERYEP
ncbi:eCIS core domain-containing protein [Chitinimonas naiadis]